MERRIVVFLALSIAVLVGNYFLQAWLRGPLPEPVAKQDADQRQPQKKGAGQEKAKKKGADEKDTERAAADDDKDADKQPPKAAEEAVDEQYFSLGSADPDSPYRMVATLTNRGAALERVELNGPRYNALDARHGYLGYLAPLDIKGGALVRVVGSGTPAAVAGLKAGDVITKIDEVQITDALGLIAALEDTKPDQQIELTVRRGDQSQTLTATLARVPAQVIRPEKDTEPLRVVKPGNHDPLSLLLTLDAVGEAQLAEDEAELPGVRLHNSIWKGSQPNDHTVEFERTVSRYNLKVVKRYQLAKADAELDDPQAAYHLTFTVELHNLDGERARDVAYRFDGPNGLPIEGWWYLNRISTEWGSVGARDVAMRFEGNPATLISSPDIAAADVDPPLRKETLEIPLVYAGVDSQYFAAVLLPQRDQEALWLSEIKHLLVGEPPTDAARAKLTNVSVRLVSQPLKLEPGQSQSHTYQLFVGPKQPALLAQYGTDATKLNDLVYYGWAIWGVVAAFLTKVLHFFYGLVGNYGIAIIMLTVVVRLCMFPLSRKQALSAQKMQELQPEMKRINEKHKGNNEARARAMQELWKKHNYNPMGGCLLAFVQLPIFIGLYRALMIDVELRGAPLFSEAIRWCSDLSAPDMLFYWGDMWPQFLFGMTGWLGPYFNVLPLFTVALFLVQQKMFMPPPTDEQSAMQQKVMTYMMVFMGVLFYKVASGLCLYFIVSSLWGIAERKLLPKMIGKPPGTSPATTAVRTPVVTASATGNGAAKSAAARKKHRGRK
ncbi:MAG: YidC/Oxa1 family insertase periplasmic-domain containing protein [Pirellulales bacterium]